MSNESKKESGLQTTGNGVAKDRMMRSPVERKPATADEILKGPVRRGRPTLETSVEENPGD